MSESLVDVVSEFYEPKAAEEVETEETAEAVSTEESEVEEESEVGESQAEEVEAETTEEVELGVDQFAAALGLSDSQIDVGDDGQLVLVGKVDGEPVKTQAKEILDKFQMYKMGDVYLKEAKEKSQKLTAEVEVKREEWAKNAATSNRILEKLKKDLDKRVSGTNWAELESDDPARYAAEKEKVREAREEIKALETEVSQSIESVKQSMAQEVMADRQRRAPEEKKRVLQHFPEYEDTSVWKAEQDQTIEYLRSRGASQDQIEEILFNGEFLAIAIKAKRYDDKRQKVEAKRKKVSVPPKVLKPGSKANGKNKPKVDDNDPVRILYG